MVQALRLKLNKGSAHKSILAELHLPAKFLKVWSGTDYIGNSKYKHKKLNDQVLHSRWGMRQPHTRELFILPQKPLQESVQDIELYLYQDGNKVPAKRLFEVAPSSKALNGKPLFLLEHKNRILDLRYTTLPLPLSTSEEAKPSSEIAAELKALGYMEE